jgi:DNA-3-methyladenine glycosylase
MTDQRLGRRFYRRDPVTLAKALLGQILVRRLDDGTELSGRIVEVEAYLGIGDKAAHSYGGRRTPRNESMWLDGGHAYVYFVYGMHWCFNVVSDRYGVPTAVLVRGLEPLTGIEEMKRRRGSDREAALCSGPAKLTQALAIDGSFDGADLTSSGRILIRRGPTIPESVLHAGPRIGVGYAGSWARRKLRFAVARSAHLSRRPRIR